MSVATRSRGEQLTRMDEKRCRAAGRVVQCYLIVLQVLLVQFIVARRVDRLHVYNL